MAQNETMTVTSVLKKKPTKFSREIIVSTIENHPEGALATINPDGTPSNSVVTLHKLSTYQYFFMTKDTTKKHDNIEMNPNVSFLIFDPFSRTELEIKGIAQYIWDATTEKRALKIINHDAKKGRHHTSPFVTKEDAYALYTLHPSSMHLSTFWDRGEGPRRYQASIEFSIKDSDYAA